MKKVLTVVLIVILSLSVTNMGFAEDNITVKLNGEVIDFDVQPQIIGGRTMVPMRAIFEKLGATVEWNQETQEITSVKKDTTVKLIIGVPSIKINNQIPRELDIAPCIVDNRTLVPVRAISEAFHMNVDWDAGTKTVLITSPNVNIVAYDTLKSAIMTKGKLDITSDYNIFYEVDSRCSVMLTYSPAFDFITLYVNFVNKYNTSFLISVYNDNNPSLYCTLESNDGTQYIVSANFPKSTESFVVEESTIPIETREAIYDAFNSLFYILDIVLEYKTDLSLSDLGIYYVMENEESGNETPNTIGTDSTSTNITSGRKWEAGQYKCGTDIEPGIYMTFASNGTGYYSITTDANGDDIVSNDNFKNNQIFEVARGQYLELSRAYAIKYEDAPLLAPENGILPEGRYRVGQHISAGTYKIQTTSNVSGYYSLTSDPNGDNIISNDNFDGERYVTIQNGQYLELVRCQMLVP